MKEMSSCLLAAALVTTGPILSYTGVNLAGAEFGPNEPGGKTVYGRDYEYPTQMEITYFTRKGMNIFRIPFRWENIQPELGRELDPKETSRLKEVVAWTAEEGAVAILDPHNYARYDGKVIGSREVPVTAFADLWRRLADTFGSEKKVWFGLMNEPHDIPSEIWVEAANSAISSIRKAGAKNFILVPGNHWSGAHSWGWSDNPVYMLKVKDPQNHFGFDVHQYLDKDSSGTSSHIESPTAGAQRLKPMTDWCMKHRRRAFLGEFGAADSPEAKAAVTKMLDHMKQNRSVWMGFAWWAAGPRWGDYMFTLEPKDQKDRPQMEWLKPYLQMRSPH